MNLPFGPRALPILCAFCLAIAACGGKAESKKDDANKEEATSAKGSSSAKAAGSAKKDAAPAAKHPWIVESGRGGAKCEFVKFEGEGDKREAKFKLTMPEGREKDVDHLQTWILYYDKAGKQIDRYPHALGYPGPEPKALGQSGDKIPKETDVLECEITLIRFKDKTAWFNDNLVPNSDPRPKGGFTDAALKEQSGEKVSVEITDPKKNHVKLKNLTDKAIKQVQIDFIYFKADGTHDSNSEWNIEVDLKPGKTIEKDITFSNDKTPKEYKTLEGYAPEVTFEDGKKWINRNISGFSLP